MCHAFQKTGIDLTLALPAHDKQLSESDMVEAIKKKIGKRPRFKIRCFPGYTVSGKLRGLGAYYGAKSLLKEYRNADLCFVRSIFLARLALYQGQRIIYESHGSIINPRSRLLNWIYCRSLLRDVQSENLVLFIAISQALAEIWKKRGVPAHKILTLHDGVSAEDYDIVKNRQDSRKSLGIKSKGKLVVYAGSLYQDRGIGDILRLAEAFPDVMFYVLGGPEKNKQYYRTLSERRDLKNVIFKGHLPHYKVKEYLYAADVLLMLWSSQIPTINICSPLKLFEYMASERIIVGYGFPTIKEILVDEETAFLANPDSYEDLEGKLRESLLQNYPNKMAKKARSIVLNKYTWENRAKTILDFLRKSEDKNLPELS